MVTFQADGHRYINEHGEQYISVTTLIGRYKKPFDSEYWSTYKGVKIVLERRGIWAQYKQRAGGWSNVVDYYKKNSSPYRDEIALAKQSFIAMWEKKGKDARERGTEYHEMMDKSSREKGHTTVGEKQYKIMPTVDLLQFQNFEDDGVYNELLLYNNDFKLAGTADKVIKEGRTVHIHDYKTSEEIEYTAFQDEVLKHPLSHIPACNFYEYSIQLSLYAWMLEAKGYQVGNLAIEHVKDNNKLHSVKYLRQEVMNLLAHYGEQVLHNSKPRFPQTGENQSAAFSA